MAAICHIAHAISRSKNYVSEAEANESERRQTTLQLNIHHTWATTTTKAKGKNPKKNEKINFLMLFDNKKISA
jgi:hypothetical protein